MNLLELFVSKCMVLAILDMYSDSNPKKPKGIHSILPFLSWPIEYFWKAVSLLIFSGRQLKS